MLSEYVGFDVETTGTDPERDRIIQIGAVLVRSGRVTARWERLVNPGCRVPAAVRRLTGITDEMLAGAPPLEAVLPELRAFLGRRPLVAHNAPFDRAFLDAACRRCLGQPWAGTAYDTLELARIALPGLASYRLADVAGQVGLAPAQVHWAPADAELAALVFGRLLDALRSYPADALMRAARILAGADPPLAALLGWAAAAGPGPAATPGDVPARPGGRGAGASDGADPWAGRTRRPDWDAVVSWLEEGGPVARSLPGYEPRPGQLRMLRAVTQVLAEGGALLVEAGTGTGKSLAYLLPALALAAGGERVVLSTHTIQLQEQIWERDLPRLTEALDLPVRAALVKGRSHYVCLWKWEALQPEPAGRPEELRFYARLALWLSRTRSGDRAELGVRREEEAAWAAVAVDEGCAGDRCRHRERCPFLRARQQAEEADLLVVNHALLLADAGAANRVLPAYRHLVCDEAHHLPEVASQQFALRLDEAELGWLLDGLKGRGPGRPPGLLDRLARRTRAAGTAGRPSSGPGDPDGPGRALEAAGEAASLAREAAGNFFLALRAAAAAGGGEVGGGAWRLPPRAAPEAWEAVLAAGGNLAGRLRALAEALAQVTASVPLEPEALAGLAARQQQVAALAATVEAILLKRAGHHGAGGEPADGETGDPGGRVAWFELSGEGVGGSPTGRVVEAALEPGPELARRLFQPLDAVVLTSATLSTGGSFDYFAAQVGLEGTPALSIAPSFSYRDQALLCLPTDVPDPAEDEESYLERACAFLGRLGPLLGGRTLVLFTSHRALREVYRRLKEQLEEAGVALLGQGLDGSQTRLAESFRRDPRAMLLGAASFWEGVDLPGEALRCVVVMRLPFRPPGHPLAEARMEAIARSGDDPFRRLALPEAVIRFRQGFGRLIRRSSDRGAVVVLDRRLLVRQASYGRAFLASLPGPRLFAGTREEVLAAVQGWVERGAIPAAGEHELLGSG